MRGRRSLNTERTVDKITESEISNIIRNITENNNSILLDMLKNTITHDIATVDRIEDNSIRSLSKIDNINTSITRFDNTIHSTLYGLSDKLDELKILLSNNIINRHIESGKPDKLDDAVSIDTKPSIEFDLYPIEIDNENYQYYKIIKYDKIMEIIHKFIKELYNNRVTDINKYLSIVIDELETPLINCDTLEYIMEHALEHINIKTINVLYNQVISIILNNINNDDFMEYMGIIIFD